MYFYLFVALMVSSDSTDDDSMAGPSGPSGAVANGANGVHVEHQDNIAGPSGAVANGTNGVTVQAEVHDTPLMLPQMINGEFYSQAFPHRKEGCKHGFCVNL